MAPPRRASRIAAVAIVLIGALVWPAWGVLQARLAVANSAGARRVVAAGCEGARGRVFVYRVALLPRGGAVCSALVRQDTFYSYVTSRMSYAHWLRYDCEVSTPGDAPYCMERPLDGLASLASWGLLLGPPHPDIQRLSATGKL